MPSSLSSNFMKIGEDAYNFDYIILPSEVGGELRWHKFYTAVYDWDLNTTRPNDWLNIKMSDQNWITYMPVQPFDLTRDPVGQFITFSDYEPPDKRPKYKRLQTLRELTPGSWPQSPKPEELWIATTLDLKIVAQIAEQEQLERDWVIQNGMTPPCSTPFVANKTAEPLSKTTDTLIPPMTVADMEKIIEKQVQLKMEKLVPDKTADGAKSDQKADLNSSNQIKSELDKPRETEAQMRDRLTLEITRNVQQSNWQQRPNDRPYQRRRRQRSRSRSYSPPPRRADHRYNRERSPVKRERRSRSRSSEDRKRQQTILIQQQQLQLEQQKLQLERQRSHTTFQLPAPELATLLPYPGSSKQQLPPTKRPEQPWSSSDWPPVMQQPRKKPTHQQMWQLFQQQMQSLADEDN